MLNRTQQSPFGLGQGSLPGGNRQPTQRAGQPPTSPGQTTMRAASFPMGAAAAALSPQSGATLPPGINSASLDPSDFPALGAQPASSGGLGSSSAASLFSSYASQAGQSSLSPGALNGAPGTATGGAPGSRRDFSADDFPVLGGAGAFGSAGQQLPPPSQHHQQQSQGMTNAAPGGGLNDLAGLSAGINGMSLAAAAAAAGRAVASPGGQEQASALAALQAQQQHRANLLGSMNGPRNPPVDKQQSWTDSPQPSANYPAGLLPNGSPSATSNASSPLPPNANAPDSSDPRQPVHSSPSGNSAGSAQTAALLAAAAAAGQAGLGGAGGVATHALPPPTSSVTLGGVPQTPAQQVLFSPADRYGLLGLLHTIKSSDPDQTMLALGTDLTNLGLDLGSSDNLYSTFITPWTDAKTAQMLNIEPEFTLPACYNVQPPPANTKIGNFSDETLFFIFYSQPRDAMQEMAAHELYKHNWRYHKELRLWLTKEAGSEPIQKTATYERGSYIFFDPVLWERVRKEFILHFESLETRRT
ncbi:hypothetical protein BMF94_6963 [Rhodotorula taiwanensis]|uniref:NOT2/NOT3/NOT5 C-terminal domain-containing protein n=1 Tax=Rhodotorula taiwanensis TaxID=741276 RepID=A0A2S5AZS1_9BASI|nr:hypothetical protein BMF94_6963 [Rhodotorula taiwanensis]